MRLIRTIEERVRPLVAAFSRTDLSRFALADEDVVIDLKRRVAKRIEGDRTEPASGEQAGEREKPRAETLSAELVGVAHLSPPPVSVGTLLEEDRELAYVDALGIRNPVRSRGAGRVAAVCFEEGQTVDYGQALFEIERT